MWHAQAIPLDFTEKFIELFTDENDLILDPFMGSWTTAVACKELKRNYIGFEFKEKYCEMIQQRLENFDKLHSSETIEWLKKVKDVTLMDIFNEKFLELKKIGWLCTCRQKVTKK